MHVDRLHNTVKYGNLIYSISNNGKKHKSDIIKC